MGPAITDRRQRRATPLGSPAGSSCASASPQGSSPTRWHQALFPVLRFGALVIGIGLVLSLLVMLIMPWINFSWWRIFRRCVSFAAAASLWLIVRKHERRSLRSYGFTEVFRVGKRQALVGALVGLGAVSLMLGTYLASDICRLAIHPDRLKLWRTVLGFVPAAALVGVLEELVFRGFILQRLLPWSRATAVIGSSAVYAAVHLRTTALALATCLELGGLFLLGVVLSLSYLRTRQLYFAVGLHAALAYGARVNKVLLTFPDPSGAAWLVGTSRLVNGLIGWMGLLGIGALVLWWLRSSNAGEGGHIHGT